MKKQAKSYKIKEARQNFSYLVKTVGKINSAYILKDRNQPKAVLIDIETTGPTRHLSFVANQ